MADEVEAGVPVEERREDAAASAHEAVVGEVQGEVALLQAEEEEEVGIQIFQGLLGDFEGVDLNNNGRRYTVMGFSIWEYQRCMWIGQQRRIYPLSMAFVLCAPIRLSSFTSLSISCLPLSSKAIPPRSP